MDAPRPERRGGKRRSRGRLLYRLLAFNLLLVFVPIAGFLYVDTYERQLLAMQERSMVQEGRILAAALAGDEPLTTTDAERLLSNLNRQTESRLRVLDAQGAVLADSSLLGPLRESAGDPAEVETRRSALYRTGAFLANLWPGRRLRGDEGAAEPAPSGSSATDFPEVRAALEGHYGAATRPSFGGQRSLTLYSALPIQSASGVTVGAVWVSRSTLRILAALYEVRVTLFVVFLWSLAAALVLSVGLAASIVRPLHRLRDESRRILDRRGRLRRHFLGVRRNDEIGDLGRALEQLTRRLKRYTDFMESFASDVSHELKNPLASIRNAAELLGEVEHPAERERFLSMIESDVARTERLLSRVRDISILDSQLDQEEQMLVDLEPLLSSIVEGFRLRGNHRIIFAFESSGPAPVRARAERLVQIFDNLLDNAMSFAPDGSTVRLELIAGEQSHRVVCRDQGPGIPADNLELIFQRFFTNRPEGKARGVHTGLGLAISRSIADAYGGTIAASNDPGGGACFVVELPAAGEGR